MPAATVKHPKGDPTASSSICSESNVPTQKPDPLHFHQWDQACAAEISPHQYDIIGGSLKMPHNRKVLRRSSSVISRSSGMDASDKKNFLNKLVLGWSRDRTLQI